MATQEILVRYLHFASILVLASALVSEHLLLSGSVTRAQLKRVRRLDAIYGIAAIVVFVTGLLQWVHVGKPAMFYTKNWIFHLKLTAFVLVAFLSIYPTVFFIRNRSGSDNEEVQIPKSVIMTIRLEMLLLFILPLLAVLIARGVGLSVG